MTLFASLRREFMMIRVSAVILVLFSAVPAFAQQAPEPRLPPSTVIEGEASASVVPDTAVISLGVVTDRPRAADALAENSRSTQVVIDTAKAEGIEPRDVQTTSVNLSPLFDQPGHGTPKLTGFRASNEVQIRVKPVAQAGPLIGKLTDRGVNSIDNVSFLSAPDEKLLDQLRGDAVRDAKHKAQVYVEALGLKLGRVLAVSPATSAAPPPFRMAATRTAAVPLPLEAGQQRVDEVVSVTWELAQ